MSSVFLELKQLHKTYYKNKRPVKQALRGVSFDIYEGEVFGLLGVNGAGKTTLSGVLSGIHPPTSGDVLWKGRSIYSDILKYRRNVGFCPQKPNIDRSLSIDETLYFAGLCFGVAKKQVLKRRDELIELLDLGSYREANADQLSGGYKQRFLIARSLMHKPRLIILDEPTVGLDVHIRKQLWKIIQDLRKDGSTVLLTTHYLEEAEALSDRVCFIHNGEIVALDTPQELNKSFKKSNLEEVFLHLVDQADKEEL